VQDADNLGWKLALVVQGIAPESLLDSYDAERVHGADENILNSTRATDFITPKTPVSKMFRNAVLTLAETLPFARTIVNSGRLSVPCTYDGSALNGPDHPEMPARTRPGSPCPDAPVGQGWLLSHLGQGFTVLTIGLDAPESVMAHGLTVPRLALEATPELAARYLGGAKGAVYLIRPDQHVAARWDHYDADAVAAAIARALGKE
jgi:3-(3-hydroxy-phenyl)propionate hydroxylase